jgi:hypothetical protein
MEGGGLSRNQLWEESMVFLTTFVTTVAAQPLSEVSHANQKVEVLLNVWNTEIEKENTEKEK